MLHSLALVASLLGPAAPPPQQADTVVIPINAITGLQFDRVRFQVPAGAPVKIVFRNNDPQDDMPHNLVVTRPGEREKVAMAGMATPREQQHVPRIPEVLVASPLLDTGDSFTLTFTAPTASGAYPYVCTYPGHGVIMYGVMYVAMEMPQLAMDQNVPPNRRTAPAPGAGAPPAWTSIRPAPGVSYGTTFPAISRGFMPESGPASIAVGFEDGESYVFDAGDSYIRYAWSGGFVDNVRHWAGNGNAYADIKGQIYYRSRVGFPLRIGGREEPKVEFLGYRLVQGGHPEFHYTVDGADVRESVTRRRGGRGLVRAFAIQTTEPVRILTDPESGVKFEASTGRWSGSVLELTPAQARQFTLTMIPAAGGTE